MTVQCNNKGMSSPFPTSPTSSSFTTDSIFTDTVTALPEIDTTKENTNTETNTVKTTSSLLNKGINKKKEEWINIVLH
jgi:single-stranded DNA-binding protein